MPTRRIAPLPPCTRGAGPGRIGWPPYCWHGAEHAAVVCAWPCLAGGACPASGSGRGRRQTASVTSSFAAGLLHHVEMWVPDLDRTARSWGWLLGELGYE